jgi:uncharacterized membrane protein YdfJ with MMPL/SSD domain
VPFTQRLASWSAARPKRIIALWVMVIVALAVVAGIVGLKPMSSTGEMTGESRRAEEMLLEAGLVPDASEAVVITSDRFDAASAEASRLAEDLARQVSDEAHVSNVRWNDAHLIAKDDEARLVAFDLDDGGSTVEEHIAPIAEMLDTADASNTNFGIGLTGGASVQKEINELVAEDLGKSESIAMPITMLILVVTFGALVAAGLPILIGAASVFAALSLGTMLSHWVPQTETAPSFVSMMGIAIGVDYTLFLLRREREERAKGFTAREALIRASATSGTAILVSGITVLVALSGLLASGTSLFSSMGLAAMLVVFTVLSGALVVLPAIMSLLGDKIERGRLPKFLSRRSKPRASESRMWSHIARTAAHRPVLATMLFGALLVAACVPVLGMKTGQTDLASLPGKLPGVQAALAYGEHFPGAPEPARIAVRSDGGSATAVDSALAAFTNEAVAAKVISGEPVVTTSADDKTLLLTVALAGAEQRETAERSLQEVRQIARDTIGKVSGIDVAVGGQVAVSKDFADTLSSHMPLVFLVVLGSAFVLLVCAFRSIVIPLVTVALNLLSVGAAYGFLVWGFQDGNMGSVMDIAGEGVVISWMPLFLFAVLFGLSMDYHVFLLSRIRERVLDGYTTRDAVVHAVATSASTITSAALIMVSVFAAFSFSSLAEMQQMGAGLAFAVLIDATIIRGVLLPSIMTLLGRANWYLPAWLNWLPGIDTEGKTVREHVEELQETPVPA